MKARDNRLVKILPNSAPQTSHNSLVLPALSRDQDDYTEWNKRIPIDFDHTFSKEKDSKHVNKKGPDLVSVNKMDGYAMISTDPLVRIHQLEQNIRFLQDQHQIMLSGLHQEVENLRQRNRDLQFKLVFCKGGVALLQSSPSSPEDELAQHKILLSPNQVNITPLQVEILERDIAELKTNLSEAKTRNVYLQNIVDEQKKKLSHLESEKLELAAVGRKIGKENIGKGKHLTSKEHEETVEELHEKVEDAERLIRRLRRENEEQRKEIVSLRSSMNQTVPENRRDGANGSNTHRGHYRSQQSYHSRFPPLHTQNYYSKTSSDYQGSRNTDREGVANRLEKESQIVGKPAPTLPHLRDRNATTSTGYSNPTYNNYQRGNANHRRHHYHRKQDDSEKYQGNGGRGSRANHRVTNNTEEQE